MANEEVELVSRPEGEKKKSLLEKWDIPIENISYEYIGKSKNAKELERIIRILRSGEEGVFPQLTKFAETRLGQIKPESAILRVAQPVLPKYLLDPAERRTLDGEFVDWLNEMKLRERDLEDEKLLDGAGEGREPLPRPAVRQITSQTKSTESTSREKEKRLASCDYAAWDKYDADTELNRIDLNDERKILEAKKLQERQKAELERTRTENVIEKSLLTGTELRIMSTREREKGNEAFRAGDYEEALRLYNISIAMDEDVSAYGNRAITHIKLKNYEQAVKDCNVVLNADCMNLKALLRRALAFEHLDKKVEALKDYESILQIDPENKTAISSVNKLRKFDESKNVRLIIEEIYDDN